MIENKKIVLGITGSIAAYKAAEITRQLKQKKAIVKVVMSHSACQFITPLTLQALTGYPVYLEQFDAVHANGMEHIELGKWADGILVAPASANFIARLSNGFSDDLLTSICLAAHKPIYLAPAMNKEMWENVLTQENVKKLRRIGIKFFGPESGVQACGDVGFGRLLEPEKIVNKLEQEFKTKLLLKEKTILVTAGPTHEVIDPVRYIANRSSGKMGYALAREAADMGAEVILISGPTHLLPPSNVILIQVTSAAQMYDEVMNYISKADVFIANAAVADYQVKEIKKNKIKKTENELILKLLPNKDILYEVSRLRKPPILIGFAAETEHLIEHAYAKLKRKNLDMIIANPVNNGQSFSSDQIEMSMMTKTGERKDLSLQSKQEAARNILEFIAEKVSKGHD